MKKEDDIYTMQINTSSCFSFHELVECVDRKERKTSVLALILWERKNAGTCICFSKQEKQLTIDWESESLKENTRQRHVIACTTLHSQDIK